MRSKQQDNKQEYISISEFARATGRSRTTVYKYLDGFLSTYVQDVQGKKVISRAAIKVFESIEAGKVVQDERTDERTEKRSDEQINGQVGQVIEALKEQQRVKDQQLEEKDRQIYLPADDGGKSNEVLSANTGRGAVQLPINRPHIPKGDGAIQICAGGKQGMQKIICFR